MERQLIHILLVSGLILLMSSCAGNPFRETNRAYRKQARAFGRSLGNMPLKDSAGLPYAANWAGTTNFGMRRPNMVIIHHTAQNDCAQTLTTFTTPRTAVSAHYVICKDGTVHHMLNDLLRAHHAGVARWGNDTDINSSSIGIEIDNNGYDQFTPEQIRSLDSLLGRLKRAYRIPVANFVGHSDIAPGRKVDPNRNFPWQQLASQGFGIWYDTAAVTLPAGFDPLIALRVIGYDVKKPESAIAAFKLHYMPNDSTQIIGEPEQKILFSLQQRSQ